MKQYLISEAERIQMLALSDRHGAFDVYAQLRDLKPITRLTDARLLDSLLRRGSQELVGVSTFRTSIMGHPEVVKLLNSASLLCKHIERELLGGEQ